MLIEQVQLISPAQLQMRAKLGKVKSFPRLRAPFHGKKPVRYLLIEVKKFHDVNGQSVGLQWLQIFGVPDDAKSPSSSASGTSGTGISVNSSTAAPVVPSPPVQKQQSKPTEVLCKCGKSVISRINRKPGPRKGQTFYVCSQLENSCGFHQWKDSGENDAPATTGASSSPQKKQRVE